MNALQASGIESGRDVGVVGIGGTDEAAAFHPALTTVLDNPATIGRMAVECGLLYCRGNFKLNRAAALAEWRQLCAA